MRILPLAACSHWPPAPPTRPRLRGGGHPGRPGRSACPTCGTAWWPTARSAPRAPSPAAASWSRRRSLAAIARQFGVDWRPGGSGGPHRAGAPGPQLPCCGRWRWPPCAPPSAVGGRAGGRGGGAARATRRRSWCRAEGRACHAGRGAARLRQPPRGRFTAMLSVSAARHGGGPHTRLVRPGDRRCSSCRSRWRPGGWPPATSIGPAVTCSLAGPAARQRRVHGEVAAHARGQVGSGHRGCGRRPVGARRAAAAGRSGPAGGGAEAATPVQHGAGHAGHLGQRAGCWRWRAVAWARRVRVLNASGARRGWKRRCSATGRVRDQRRRAPVAAAATAAPLPDAGGGAMRAALLLAHRTRAERLRRIVEAWPMSAGRRRMTAHRATRRSDPNPGGR